MWGQEAMATSIRAGLTGSMTAKLRWRACAHKSAPYTFWYSLRTAQVVNVNCSFRKI